MAEFYWYISTSKVNLLKNTTNGLFSRLAMKIEFKAPFVSGEVTSEHSAGATDISNLVRELRRVAGALESEMKIKNYQDLDSSESPVMVRFNGPAVKRLQDEKFWMAMDHDETALLLAGSASNVIGYRTQIQGTLLPSIDPVGAFIAAFSSDPSNQSQSEALSYAWREIMKPTIDSGGSIPRVEGLAIFARTLSADRDQARLADRRRIRHLVVGTPLYVRQI